MIYDLQFLNLGKSPFLSVYPTVLGQASPVGGRPRHFGAGQFGGEMRTETTDKKPKPSIPFQRSEKAVASSFQIILLAKCVPLWQYLRCLESPFSVLDKPQIAPVKRYFAYLPIFGHNNRTIPSSAMGIDLPLLPSPKSQLEYLWPP